MRRSSTALAPIAALLIMTGCGQSHQTGADLGVSDGGGGTGSTCAGPSECRVVPQSCCGTCGAATRGDALSLHEDDVDSHRAMACDGNTVGCPRCAQRTDPTLVGTCTAGQCALVDLQTRDDLTACATPSDCRLRTVDCCECGGDNSAGNVVAVRTDAEQAVSALLCDAGTFCLECQPAPPQGVIADCVAGRCEAVFVSP